ncbi:MAG: hypothetical protein EPN82_13055 [Bacteroidetes bacterium]|nr:MAG: hypothetical protein EPN82_13055 [Bacteroidota bacterium]
MQIDSEISKEQLIDKMLRNEISPDELSKLLSSIDKTDFRKIIKRIFDINESDVVNKSGSEQGLLGFLNGIDRNRKNKKFIKAKKKKDWRKNRKVIIAEGDSWFEYPIIIKDILDWLIKMKDNKSRDYLYNVCTVASGGDWIANILYEEQYIEEISLYEPEAFLISGGGNDLVGESRISKLVKKRAEVDTSLTIADRDIVNEIIVSGFTHKQAERIQIGRKFLNKEFYSLLNLFRIQYSLVFKSIELSGKFSNMKIITQGYDFAIPSNNRNIFINPLRWLMHNGQWLYYPLLNKGISDSEEQRCVIAAMIHEHNELLIDIGKPLNNVYHIDSRGALKDEDWADELHAYSKGFKRIAEVYSKCINSIATSDKVIKVGQMFPN